MSACWPRHSANGSHSSPSLWLAGTLLCEYLAYKRHRQTPLRLQCGLIDGIQQLIQRRQIAAEASLQVKRGFLRQFQPTRMRPQPQRLALLGLIERTQRQQRGGGKTRRQVRQRKLQQQRWRRGGGQQRGAALLGFAIQPEQGLLPVTPARDCRQIVKRHQARALPALERL